MTKGHRFCLLDHYHGDFHPTQIFNLNIPFQSLVNVSNRHYKLSVKYILFKPIFCSHRSSIPTSIRMLLMLTLVREREEEKEAAKRRGSPTKSLWFINIRANWKSARRLRLCESSSVFSKTSLSAFLEYSCKYSRKMMGWQKDNPILLVRLQCDALWHFYIHSRSLYWGNTSRVPVCMLLFTLLLLDVVLNVVGGKTVQSSLIASCLTVAGFSVMFSERHASVRFSMMCFSVVQCYVFSVFQCVFSLSASLIIYVLGGSLNTWLGRKRI